MFLEILMMILILQGYGAPFYAEVVRIQDGDSITVMRDGEEIVIRLFGVDCPERGTKFDSQSRRFTAKMLRRRQVKVIPKERDQFGRVVARVLVGKTDISLELLRAGLAWHFTRFSRDSELAKAQEMAQDNRVGIWSQSDPVPPWEFRADQEKSLNRKEKRKEPELGLYHGNMKSKVFHKSSCRYYDCRSCTRLFYSKSQAVSAGFRPCRWCEP